MNWDINSAIPVSSRSAAASMPATTKERKTEFQGVLQKELKKGQELIFSAHAEKRLRERKIVLAREDLAKIGQAVKQAAAKGARESLIIYGDLALIASVKNKTVVTALDGKSITDHVFTNIDSAVIIK